MKMTLMAAVFVAAFGSAAHADKVLFNTDAAGATPAGWTIAKTGKGEPKWTVEADATAPASQGKVLKQSGKATYPLALKTGSLVGDGFVQTKFKAISGSEDRAAGLIWRAKDADNYYVARANALEDNVVLYKTTNGKRVELPTTTGATYGLKAPVPPNAWHTLRVEFAGTRFKVIYNGQLLFEVEDASLKDAGMVGLWTKADSVTLFDGFEFAQNK